MKLSQRIAVGFVVYGVVLHTYTAVAETTEFNLGFLLWALTPYIVASVLLWRFRQPQAAVGALIIPVLMDAGNFYAVFVAPEHSTAALGLLFVPLWNLTIFVPAGGAVGWWVGKRLRETALSSKTIEPTR